MAINFQARSIFSLKPNLQAGDNVMYSILRGSCWPVEALKYLGQRLGGKILDGKHMAHAHRAWYEN